MSARVDGLMFRELLRSMREVRFGFGLGDFWAGGPLGDLFLGLGAALRIIGARSEGRLGSLLAGMVVTRAWTGENGKLVGVLLLIEMELECFSVKASVVVEGGAEVL